MQSFIDEVKNSYNFKWEFFELGAWILKWKVFSEAKVKIPLATMNRHWLIAGATGTWKTKTIQKIIESLSKSGVSTVVMDIKWDVSWIAVAGEINEKISSRLNLLQIKDWKETWFPCEFYSLTNSPWVRLRSTISEFWPILFSKLLELNDTQSWVISIIFKYCDDNWLLLLDLEDIKKVLQYAINEWKDEIWNKYWLISSSTIGTIMRKIVELESQWAEIFFSEPSFMVSDFLKKDDLWNAFVNILRLSDMQSKPKLFSTFMLSLITEIYWSFPEVWDTEKPKLVLFIDEAHLIFENISKNLLDQMEMVIKLIRSKWVWIFFCTQNPTDIPASILSQLWLKVQHALRAFTAIDRDAIKKASENFPISNYYDIKNDLIMLWVWEAFVTVLNEKWIPTPLVHTMILPPESRMDILSDIELNSLVSISDLVKKYNIETNRENANEILGRIVSEKIAMQEQKKLEEETNFSKSVWWKIVKWVGSTVASEIWRSLWKKVFWRTGWTIWAQIARGIFGGLFR